MHWSQPPHDKSYMFQMTLNHFIGFTLFFVISIGIHGYYRSLPNINYQVPNEILDQVDEQMHDMDPSAIHIMQMVLGSRAPRFQNTFLKSLFLHHFEKSGPNAAPIHLHLLTDKATRFILEGILGSWRIDNLRSTYYPAENVQDKINWMSSFHSATNVATMKMYLPEILNSTVSKVMLLDGDIILLTDIANLWKQFDEFGKNQFLGMAIEQAPMYFNFKKIHGSRVGYGYNAGVMLWYTQRLTQRKWDAIWQPTFVRAQKFSPYFGSAEQTLINAVIVENPMILHPLPCTWNVQMFELGTPNVCQHTWNAESGQKYLPEPQLLHADRWNKREEEYMVNGSEWNNADLTGRYIILRSHYHLMDGYWFRKSSPQALPLDLKSVMNVLHPGGSYLSPFHLCQSNLNVFQSWCHTLEPMTFTVEHRIHPLYVANEYKNLVGNINGITLAITVDFEKFQDIEVAARIWSGRISAAIYSSDLQAHKLLTLIRYSKTLHRRGNIYYHIVYKNSKFPPAVALHNTAVTYAPTNQVLLLETLDEALMMGVQQLVESAAREHHNGPVITIFDRAHSTEGGQLCVERHFRVRELQNLGLDQLRGLLVPTNQALLPNELDRGNIRWVDLAAILANALW